MNSKWIGPKPGELDLTDSSVHLYAEEVAVASDEKLLELLAGWKPDTHRHLITQAEIDRRKQAAKDAREDNRYRQTEFRSWVSVGISVLHLSLP